MTHDNVTDFVERGYAAAENGEPERPNLRKFSEGWNVYHDGKYWDEIAAQIGAKLYGFTFRNSATFIFPNGDLLESSKGLLTAISTLRKQLAAQDGLVEALEKIANMSSETLWDIPDRDTGERPAFETLDAEEVRGIARKALSAIKGDKS